jgi:hypothetical protein
LVFRTRICRSSSHNKKQALFLFLLRLVNSPFGRVLQAIRENEFRAEAIGYRRLAGVK